MARPLRKIIAAIEVDESSNKVHTSYMMLVGSDAISAGSNSIRSAEIAEGPKNTIMIVEVADSGVHWAEPVDLRIDDLDFQVNADGPTGISSHHMTAVRTYCSAMDA